MTSLTDRYVWAVLRAVPESQRASLEPELREMVADAVDARGASGLAPAAAEREALVELGDPELLAARYTDRSLTLLGPTAFLAWQRLLRILLPIVIPIGVGAVLLAGWLDGAELGALVGSAIGAAVNVAIQTVFWVTLVFAVVDRVARKDLEGQRWTPDQLPALPAGGRASVTDLVTDVVSAAVTAGALLWQQVARPIVLDGEAYPLFADALSGSWIPVFLGILVAQIVLAVAVFLAGRWTWPFAAVNAVLGLAFALPAVWLLQTGQLFEPAVLAAVEAAGAGSAIAPTTAIISIVVLGVGLWEAADGFLKAHRATRSPVLATV